MWSAGSKMKALKDKVSISMKTYYPKTSDETFAIGEKFSQTILPQSVICFFGELGAGKTTFIKGMAQGLNINPSDVNSPTFQYLNIYNGKTSLFHFDLYRLQGVDDFLSLGFDEFFSQPGISCIEWTERIPEIIPKNAFKVSISHTEDGGRQIEITQ